MCLYACVINGSFLLVSQGGNNISAEGTAHLAAALKDNSTITTVSANLLMAHNDCFTWTQHLFLRVLHYLWVHRWKYVASLWMRVK